MDDALIAIAWIIKAPSIECSDACYRREDNQRWANNEDNKSFCEIRGWLNGGVRSFHGSTVLPVQRSYWGHYRWFLTFFIFPCAPDGVTPKRACLCVLYVFLGG